MSTKKRSAGEESSGASAAPRKKNKSAAAAKKDGKLGGEKARDMQEIKRKLEAADEYRVLLSWFHDAAGSFEHADMVVPAKGLSAEHAACIRALAYAYAARDKKSHARHQDMTPLLTALFNEWRETGLVQGDAPLSQETADLYILTDRKAGEWIRGTPEFKLACRRMMDAVILKAH